MSTRHDVPALCTSKQVSVIMPAMKAVVASLRLAKNTYPAAIIAINDRAEGIRAVNVVTSP